MTTAKTLEVFKHTGFKPGDVPDSGDTLRRLWEPSVFPPVIVLQDRGLATVDIATTWDGIKNADYVCVGGSTYYWVVNITMLNDQAARLTMAPDHLTTMGIENIDVVSGWCTRRHVTIDPLFGNVMDEPFSPQQAMVIDMGEKVEPSIPGFNNLICCTVDLEKFEFEADAYKDATGAAFVWVPKVPPSSAETKVYFNSGPGAGVYEFTMPQVSLWDIDDPVVQEKIQSLRSLGIEGSIISTYKIPQGYGVVTLASGGRIDTIGSPFYTREVESLPFEYAEVKNKKALSGQYNRYRLYSIVSGDSAEYRSDEIFEYGTTNPSVVMFADAQPKGKPYCRPKVYKGNEEDIFIECIEGAEWQNYQLAFNGASGQAFLDLAQNRKRFEQTMQGLNQVGNAVGSIVSGIKDPGAAISAATNIVTNGAMLAANINSSEQDYANQQATVIPDIRFPISNNLQSYVGNGFWMARVRLSDSDIVRFDAFLTQFGYAVSEPLKKEFFTGRVHFNYIQANTVNIKNREGHPFDLVTRMGAISQIEGGVRIWHTEPDIAKMYDNPIG